MIWKNLHCKIDKKETLHDILVKLCNDTPYYHFDSFVNMYDVSYLLRNTDGVTDIKDCGFPLEKITFKFNGKDCVAVEEEHGLSPYAGQVRIECGDVCATILTREMNEYDMNHKKKLKEKYL